MLDFSSILYCLQKQKEYGLKNNKYKIGIIIKETDGFNHYRLGDIVFFTDDYQSNETITLEKPMPKEFIDKKRCGFLTTWSTTVGVPRNYVKEIDMKYVK